MKERSERVVRAQQMARHPVQEARERLSHQRPDNKIGDWVDVAPEKWNIHQKVAAKTLGIVSVANAISVSGALLSAHGIKDYANGKYWGAVWKMGLGRSLDLVDGVVAQKTGTRSVAGAGIDAGLDKLLALGFITAVTAHEDMSPEEASLHLSQQVSIVRTNWEIKQNGGEPNPGRAGKYGQAALWLRGGGIVLHRALAASEQAAPAMVAKVASIVCGLQAVQLNAEANDAYREYLNELKED